MLGDARRPSCRSKLPLEKILLALGSTKIFGISPIGLDGDAAGTGYPQQRDGLVVEGLDASASSSLPTAIAGGDSQSSAELL